MTDTLIETGLTGALVNQPEPPAQVPVVVPPAVPPAVPAANMPDGWTISKVARLVRDLSTNMYDLAFVLKTHGLTQAQYDGLAASEAFQSALRAMTIEWNTIGNTQKRLALEAAIYLEDALPAVAARLSKATEPLPGVVELAKLLAKMAGIGEAAQNNAPTERFKITINLGADVQQFEKTRPVVEIQSQPQGPGADGPIQSLIGTS
jgi:hypothetical protein